MYWMFSVTLKYSREDTLKDEFGWVSGMEPRLAPRIPDQSTKQIVCQRESQAREYVLSDYQARPGIYDVEITEVSKVHVTTIILGANSFGI